MSNCSTVSEFNFCCGDSTYKAQVKKVLLIKWLSRWHESRYNNLKDVLTPKGQDASFEFLMKCIDKNKAEFIEVIP